MSNAISPPDTLAEIFPTERDLLALRAALPTRLAADIDGLIAEGHDACIAQIEQARAEHDDAGEENDDAADTAWVNSLRNGGQ